MTEQPHRGDALAAVVAGNVRAERHRQRLRQADLAERIGWSRAALAALEAEHRRVSLSDAVDLCAGLAVPLSTLLAGPGGAEARRLLVLVEDPAEDAATAAVYRRLAEHPGVIDAWRSVVRDPSVPAAQRLAIADALAAAEGVD